MGMEERLIEFVTGLRAAGVRISVAESADSFRAVEEIGAGSRNDFRSALRTTLVKEPTDVPTFERLFPMYFGVEAPPMQPATGGMNDQQKDELRDALDQLPAELRELLERLLNGELTPEEMEQLRQRLQQRSQDEQQNSGGQPGSMQDREMQHLMEQLNQAMMNRLAQLLNWLLSGEGPNEDQLGQIGKEVGLPRANHPYQQKGLSERMLRAMGMEQLQELLAKLMQQLSEAGVGEQTRQEIGEQVQANAEALGEQVNQFVGQSIARQIANQQPQAARVSDLMQRPFQSLSEQEANELRNQVRRLAAQLRSRASLRYRKGKTGILDPKATLRANLRYGGIPVELRHRHRHLKPKLLLICDVSTSMRQVVEFLLSLVYELQDQVARARSFAFIDDIREITDQFAELRPEVAIQQVLDEMPPGYYNTDLGFALKHFVRDHLDAVDRRTTVIMVGDARNNFNPPRLDAFATIKRRARKVVWFNPEARGLWGTGDSDMPKYLGMCDSVHVVNTLAQLADAVDRLLVPM
ncbi:MAG TPA: VWA domain-containing protein [Anaerolineae bacterium]